MKNKTMCLSIALLLQSFIYSYSQTNTVSIFVGNKQKKGVDGSMALVDSANTFLVGNVFNNGTIRLSVNYLGKATLTISSINYTEMEKQFEIKLGENKLDSIFLDDKVIQLAAVVVETKKPLFEKNIDGLKVNIENSILSKSSSAAEMLGKIPTVSIAGNTIQVFGRGEALIILNGKEISYNSFKSLPVTDIKSVEVITNPDAKYDAKGKAVIIVTMQKHYHQGLTATLTNATTVGIIKDAAINKYIVQAPNISINFKKNKFDYSAYYGQEIGTIWAENNFITSVVSTTGTFKKIGYYTEDNKNKGVHFYRLGVGYQLNDKSNISCQYDGLSHLFNLDVKQNGDYYGVNSDVTLIRMNSAASTKLVNHSFNTNYFVKTDSVGSSLFIGLQYNKFTNQLFDRLTESINNKTYNVTSNRINDGLNTITIYAAQSDYVKKLGNNTVELGAKYSQITNDGKIKFYSKLSSENDYTENQLFANSTLYTEKVAAAYGLYKLNFGKTQATVGLRAEQTNALGVSNKLAKTIIDMNYFNLFPSAKLSTKLTKDIKCNLTYNYKINRPLYQDLDPFLWYLDSLTSIQGNSKLVPEYLHQIEIKFLYKWLGFKYAFTKSVNTIASIMMPGNNGPNAVTFIKDNLNGRTIHQLGFEANFSKGNYSSYNSAMVNFYQFKDDRPQYKAANNIPQFYLYTYQAYIIPKWFTTELTAEFYSASSDGFTQRKPYYYCNVGISKNFLPNENLQVSVLMNDVFRTAVWAGNFNVNTYGNDYNQRFTMHYLRLNVSYTFLSKASFNYSNKNINEAEYNRIKK